MSPLFQSFLEKHFRPCISVFHLLANRFYSINRECGSTLAVGIQHAVPPINTKFKRLLIPSQAGMPFTNTHKHRTSDFKSTHTCVGPTKYSKSISAARQKQEILANSSLSIIRECGSTLYIGLAHTAPPTCIEHQI